MAPAGAAEPLAKEEGVMGRWRGVLKGGGGAVSHRPGEPLPSPSLLTPSSVPTYPPPTRRQDSSAAYMVYARACAHVIYLHMGFSGVHAGVSMQARLCGGVRKNFLRACGWVCNV